ncbi:hypothetical protein MITS9509_01848 [Synechococcus sp. MIT S9509]|nr:hypothetical protein MITS9509_01848 [Synechococcus sp. MIT S9509]
MMLFQFFCGDGEAYSLGLVNLKPSEMETLLQEVQPILFG